MDLSILFEKTVEGLAGDLSKAIRKWQRLIFGKIYTIEKITKRGKEDIFQDFMLEMFSKYERYKTDLYTFENHTYVLTDRTLGPYVWIETPEWNKKYVYGRWILRENLEEIQKSSLVSYIYRQIIQFQADYISNCLTVKNGYGKKVRGKKFAKVYSGRGDKGVFSKEIGATAYKSNILLLSMEHSIYEDEKTKIKNKLADTSPDSCSDICFKNLLEVMADNMSERGFEIAYRINILGEVLTLGTKEVKLFNREMELVQMIISEEDPLCKKITGVCPVRFSLENI